MVNPVRIVNGRPETGGCTGGYWAEGTIWSPDGRYLTAPHATRCQDGQSWWWGAAIIGDHSQGAHSRFLPPSCHSHQDHEISLADGA